MRARYRWMVGSLMALAMSGAWAEGAGGRITFIGAVVVPTCAADAMLIDAAETLSPRAMQAPRHLACGQAVADSGRTYSRTVQAVDATSAAHDYLLGYLASYVPVGPGGKPVVSVIVRTYD